MPDGVGFVVALASEAAPLRRLHSRGSPARASVLEEQIVLCGGGPERARQAALRLRATGARALVSWGVCGALSPLLVPGTLVLPASVQVKDGLSYRTSNAWRERLCEQMSGKVPIDDGVLIQSSQIVTTIAEKQYLHRQFHAVAVDMESAAVAEVAFETDLPFLAIRAVVDAAGTAIPDVLTRMVDEAGRIRVRRIIGAPPAAWRSLGRLATGFHAARRTLSLVASEAAEALLAVIQTPSSRA